LTPRARWRQGQYPWRGSQHPTYRRASRTRASSARGAWASSTGPSIASSGVRWRSRSSTIGPRSPSIASSASSAWRPRCAIPTWSAWASCSSTAGSLCFSMELIEGVDLASWVMAGARADRVRSALVQLAGALAALHRAGVIHRDVKPANVMVTTDDRVVPARPRPGDPDRRRRTRAGRHDRVRRPRAARRRRADRRGRSLRARRARLRAADRPDPVRRRAARAPGRQDRARRAAGVDARSAARRSISIG
jgi:serine/threonine protein kinase